MSLRRALRAVGIDLNHPFESFKQILRKIDLPGQSVKNFRRVRCRDVSFTELLTDQG